MKPDAPVHQLAAWIKVRPGVNNVRTNSFCGSITVYYDPKVNNVPNDITEGFARLDINSLPDTPAVNGAADAQVQLSTQRQEITTGWKQLLQPNGYPALAIASGGLLLSLFPASSLLTSIAIGLSAYSSLPSFIRACSALHDEHRLNVDVLDSLAICVSAFQGNPFTTAFMAWLITLGDWIRDQTAARSKRAIADLLGYQQRVAWVRRRGEKISIPVKEIAAGDVVIVYDGEMIPVDGQVVSGRATVDQRNITGESMPVVKSRGGKVYAASIVQEGKLYLRAERTAADSLAAQIVQMVESAPVGETRMQNYAEKFADKLVAPSLGLAALLYLITRDVNRALSVLIVDFGTGIRVAAPTSVLASMSAAVRRGLLIRGGNRMERLSQLDAVVFDKTGTLTLGAPRITEIISYNDRSFPPAKILEIAAAAEMRLKHPVAYATVAKARESHVTIPARTDSKYRVGMGVEARINGYYVHVGSERFLRDNQIDINRASSNCRQANRNGQSSLILAVDGEMIGQLVYEDQIRPESPDVIKALKERDIRNVVMITGDNAAPARHVASALGITDLFAEILPNEKAEIIQDLRKQGKVVAMVGDGINDAAALSYADVGIAMKNGSDLAQESAHVVLVQDDLSKVVTAIDIARNAVRLIHQNYSLVVAMNVVALAMALGGGLISPEITALISNGSAVAASINGLRPLVQ